MYPTSRACMHAGLAAFMGAGQQLEMTACMHISLHAHTRVTFLHAYRIACLHAGLPACMRSNSSHAMHLGVCIYIVI